MSVMDTFRTPRHSRQDYGAQSRQPSVAVRSSVAMATSLRNSAVNSLEWTRAGWDETRVLKCPSFEWDGRTGRSRRWPFQGMGTAEEGREGKKAPF
ncbi:hypothetical protein MHYP_G00242890 [Metynnis hypsauchen]